MATMEEKEFLAAVDALPDGWTNREGAAVDGKKARKALLASWAMDSSSAVNSLKFAQQTIEAGASKAAKKAEAAKADAEAAKADAEAEEARKAVRDNISNIFLTPGKKVAEALADDSIIGGETLTIRFGPLAEGVERVAWARKGGKKGGKGGRKRADGSPDPRATLPPLDVQAQPEGLRLAMRRSTGEGIIAKATITTDKEGVKRISDDKHGVFSSRRAWAMATMKALGKGGAHSGGGWIYILPKGASDLPEDAKAIS